MKAVAASCKDFKEKDSKREKIRVNRKDVIKKNIYISETDKKKGSQPLAVNQSLSNKDLEVKKVITTKIRKNKSYLRNIQYCQFHEYFRYQRYSKHFIY